MRQRWIRVLGFALVLSGCAAKEVVNKAPEPQTVERYKNETVKLSLVKTFGPMQSVWRAQGNDQMEVYIVGPQPDSVAVFQRTFYKESR